MKFSSFLNDSFRAFFLKTRCSRTHHKPDITNTLLAVNMYSNFQMQYGLDEEYDLGREVSLEKKCEVWFESCSIRYWIGIRRIGTI